MSDFRSLEPKRGSWDLGVHFPEIRGTMVENCLGAGALQKGSALQEFE